MSDIGAEERNGDYESYPYNPLTISEDSDNDEVSVPIALNVSLP